MAPELNTRATTCARAEFVYTFRVFPGLGVLISPASGGVVSGIMGVLSLVVGVRSVHAFLGLRFLKTFLPGRALRVFGAVQPGDLSSVVVFVPLFCNFSFFLDFLMEHLWRVLCVFVFPFGACSVLRFAFSSACLVLDFGTCFVLNLGAFLYSILVHVFVLNLGPFLYSIFGACLVPSARFWCLFDDLFQCMSFFVLPLSIYSSSVGV